MLIPIQLTETYQQSLCHNCTKNQGTKKLHGCPLKEDVDGNYEFKCNCCDDCKQVCLDSI